MDSHFELSGWFGKLEPKDIADYHHQRQLSFIPTHFITCATEKNKTEVFDWIYTHANGRFAVVEQAVPHPATPHLKITRVVAGFEDPNDALLFSLSFT